MANLSNITNQSAAPQIVATGTLAAGQTDIGLSVSFQVNQYPAAQLGAVLVYVNGQLMLRNTGNATAAPTADGNYQEVDAGSGFSSLIRLNVADPLNARPYAIISNGFNIAQPSTTVQSQIQTLQTQQDNMATTLAEVAGIAVSSLYTPLNDATRATFAAQFTTLQSDAALKNVSNTFTAPQLIPGRTDGAAIGAGYIGQYVEWTTTATTAPATGIIATVGAADAGQITLGPGVWDIIGSGTYNTSSSNTFTYGTLFIGTAPGASSAGIDYARNYVNQIPVVSGTSNWMLQTPVFRVNITNTQTFYLKTQNGYSGAGTVSIVYPLLRATRIA